MKILHTADIHLGSNHYGRIDPVTGLDTRLMDFQRCFEFMVQRGIEEDIDLFLFAGDAYRTADPTPTQQKIFAECLRPLAERGIPVVMIVGNHDHPVSFGKASAIDIFSYITGTVHVFRRPEFQVIPTKSGPLQFIALPWPIRSMILSREEHRRKSPVEVREFIESLYAGFVRQTAAEIDPALPTVLAAHLSVQGAELSGSERTSMIAHEPVFTVGQLAVPPIDYVALGHIHRYQDRNPGATPPVVYSSSIERVSMKEAGEDKGFVLVDIDARDGRKETRYEFVRTPARPFVLVDIDATGSVDPTEVILRALDRHDTTDAVVRVRFKVDENQAAAVDVYRIREALRSAYTIAGIERAVKPVERQRRSVVAREATLEEALRQYLAQHDHLAPLEDELVRAALALEAACDADRRNDA